MEKGRSRLMAKESIFDALPSELTEHDIADLHRKTEYLLDEMEMGGADHNAFGGNGDRHSSDGSGSADLDMNSTQPRDRFDHLDGRTQHYHADASGTGSQVLPETALPSIRREPKHAPKQETAEDISRQRLDHSQRPHATHGRSQARSQPTSSYDELFPSRRRAVVPVSKATYSVSVANAHALEDEIAKIYEQINRLQEKRQSITGHALSLLQEARTIIHSQPERIARAESNIRQVRSILERDKENRRRSIRNSSVLLVYLTLWTAICAAGITGLILYHTELVSILRVVGKEQSALAIHGIPFLWTLLAGATGGMLGAVISLVSLMREGQVFDRQYVMRYMIQPIMGIVLAILIYLLSFYMFKSTDGDLTANLLTQSMPAIIALPAALWQENVYGLLFRLTRFFRFSRRR
jgi:hypothetical protein